MTSRRSEQVHGHAGWQEPIQTEYSDDGALHRHRVVGKDRVVRYTTWQHNTRSHAHRLPDGAWTRPRTTITAPVTATTAAASVT